MQKAQKSKKPICECPITHRNKESDTRVAEKNLQKIRSPLDSLFGIKEDEKDKNKEPP